MLLRVEVGKLQLGMFIGSIDGSWLNNPFWRSRFLLVDDDDLARLRQSGVDGVTIDIAKGGAPAPVAATPATENILDERIIAPVAAAVGRKGRA